MFMDASHRPARLLVASFLGSVGGCLLAATVHIDPGTPAGASSDGSREHPFKTWGKVQIADGNTRVFFIANGERQTRGILEHNDMRGPLTDGDGGAIVYSGTGSGLVVRHNTFSGPVPGGIYHHSRDLQVYGNVFGDLPMGVANHTDSRCRVFNNTFHNVDLCVVGRAVAAVNNIFSLPREGQRAFTWKGGLVEKRNLVTRGPAGPDRLIGDPLFNDVAAGDFRLTPGSPAIDAGIVVGSEIDREGTRIPTGKAPDIGAFEWHGVDVR